MIDRETAIQWAKDAGFFRLSTSEVVFGEVRPKHIEALITRAMNEAYEQAAKQVEHICKEGGGTYGDAIRALKEQP